MVAGLRGKSRTTRGRSVTRSVSRPKRPAAAPAAPGSLHLAVLYATIAVLATLLSASLFALGGWHGVRDGNAFSLFSFSPYGRFGNGDGKAPLRSPLLDVAPPSSAVSGTVPPEMDVAFDPETHLDLRSLAAGVTTHGLKDLGYNDTEIGSAYSPVSHSEVFRLLSDEGLRVLQAQLRYLSNSTRSSGRIERFVRGTVFRSKFLRGLALSPEITEFVGRTFGLPVAPNTIPHHLGHVNYSPKVQPKRSVDKWHTDNVPFTYVLFATDLSGLDGGEFELFFGTGDDAAAGKVSNRSRVMSIGGSMGCAGCAVMLQGKQVVHRAAPLRTPGERMTYVNSYVPAGLEDYDREATRPRILRAIDDDNVVSAEWIAHRALRARAGIDKLLRDVDYTRGADWCAKRLEAIGDEISSSVHALRTEKEGLEDHYGDG